MLKSANKTETNVYTLEVTVSGEDFNKAILQAYNKQKNKIQLPGFRKGKAPLKMIEQFYGEGVFYEDALDIVYPDVVSDAIKEAGIEPVAAPHDLDVTKIGKDGVEMTMKVTVKPEITIENYKGIEADKGHDELLDAELVAARLGRHHAGCGTATAHVHHPPQRLPHLRPPPPRDQDTQVRRQPREAVFLHPLLLDPVQISVKMLARIRRDRRIDRRKITVRLPRRRSDEHHHHRHHANQNLFRHPQSLCCKKLNIRYK